MAFGCLGFFFNAGYRMAKFFTFRRQFVTGGQVFEVIMGVALKTMTNCCNHLAGAEPDAEFVRIAQLVDVA